MDVAFNSFQQTSFIITFNNQINLLSVTENVQTELSFLHANLLKLGDNGNHTKMMCELCLKSPYTYFCDIVTPVAWTHEMFSNLCHAMTELEFQCQVT